MIKFFTLGIILLYLYSCHSSDYYNSDAYKIKKRQEVSYEMFKKTHQVRNKCSGRKRVARSRKRKQYYN